MGNPDSMLAILGLKRNGGIEEEEEEEEEDDGGAEDEEAMLVDEEELWAELKALVGNMLCKSFRK